jgi:hypothetical protein
MASGVGVAVCIMASGVAVACIMASGVGEAVAAEDVDF